jgi:D-alanyl-D-alanine carboxypeptidase
VAELIAMVRELPLAFEPGTSWAYSNTGYLLLGPVIERVSGRTFAEYVEAELAAPLGLRETGPCRDQDPRAAVGYRPGPDGFIPATPNQLGGPFADGDLCSSVRDLLRWTAALADGRVIAPDAYRRMTTRVRLNDGVETHHGYGFDLLHHDGAGRTVEHGGGVAGFRGHLAHYPEQGVVIAVLTNRGTGAAQMLRNAIASELFAGLEPATLDLELPAGRAGVYAGTYLLYLQPTNQGPFPIEIAARDGRVFAEAEGTEIPLRWQGDDEFAAPEHGLRLRFVVEGDRAVRLALQRSGMQLEGARR